MPRSTSQRSVLSTRRTRPRWCDHQTYSTSQPRSLASSAAISFSIPSSFWFEKGMLFGSPQTRSAFFTVALSSALDPGAKMDDASPSDVTERSRPTGVSPYLFAFIRFVGAKASDGVDIEHPTLLGGIVQTRLVSDP